MTLGLMSAEATASLLQHLEWNLLQRVWRWCKTRLSIHPSSYIIQKDAGEPSYYSVQREGK